MRTLLLSICLALTVTTGCFKKKDSGSSSNKKAQRQDGSSSKLTISGGTLSLTGDKSIDLNLTYNPGMNKGDQASTLLCVDVFGADEEIGEAVCVADDKKTMPVLAKHVNQICQGSNNFGLSAPAKEELKFEGCDAFELRLHTFDPVLEISFGK